MAIQLQGNPYNLQGSVPSLQGGNVANVLQPAQAPAGFVGPIPQPATTVQKPAPVRAAAPRAAAPAQPQIRDLGSAYGLVNGTVYRKRDNYAFSNPQDFFQDAGVASFDNLRFDTAYQPVQQPQQTFGFGDGSVYDQNQNRVQAPQQAQPQPQPQAAPNQSLAQTAGQANLSFDDYMKVISTQNGLSAAETQAIRDSLGIGALEGEVFKTPSKNTEQIYADVYASSGLADLKTRIQALDQQIAARKQQITDAQGAVNENPFLSEGNRVGRIKRLNDQAEASLGNLIDQYNSLQSLYTQGLSEVNNAVTRQSNDFNTSRELAAEKLAYLSSKADQLIKERTGDKVTGASANLSDYLKAKTQQSNEPSVTSPRKFALENNITQPFYDIGGTIYRTSDGKAYASPEEFFADGGARDFSNAQKVTGSSLGSLKDYPSSYQEYLLAKQDGFTGTYNDYQTADANRKARVASAGAPRVGGLTPNQVNSTVNQIAGAFDNEPIVKNYNVLAEGKAFADSISNNTQNPADQQGLIYAFAKAMDPASVVREGEYATVQKYAQSWAQTFGFNAARIFSNSPFLSAQAIANMKSTINSKFQAAKKNYDNVYSEYQRQIQGAYTGQPRQITDYSKAFNQPASGGGSSASLDDLF
jgi:hypothetical protein